MVFGPAGSLHGYSGEAVVVELLGGNACIDGVRAVVLGEGSGVDAYAHLPHIGIPAARTAAEGIAHAAQQRGGQTVDGSDVGHGVRPQQQVAAVLDVLLNTGGCITGHVREVPDVVRVARLNVAQPEEHAVVGNVLYGIDVAEVDVLALGVVGLEPEPC